MQTAPATPPRVDPASTPAGRSLRAPLIVALAAVGCVTLLLQPLGGDGLFPIPAKSEPNTSGVTWGVSARAAVSEASTSAPEAEPAAPAPEPSAPAVAATEPAVQLATGLRSRRQLAAMAVPSPPIHLAPAPDAALVKRGKPVAIASPMAPAASKTQAAAPPAREALPLETAVVPLDAATIRVVTRPAAPGQAVSNFGARSGSSRPNG